MDMEKTQMVYGLYGSHIKRSKCVGYCYYHNAHLTAKTLKQHKCLSKQCGRLKKHEENDFWRQREQKKEMRKARKERLYSAC